MIRIAALTSSRADYGIYRPLFKGLEADPGFDLHVIAFGTHVSTFYGRTIQQIEAEHYSKLTQVESMVLGDSQESVSTAMGLTMQKFASVWKLIETDIDLVLCLGDRYEMFAAVSAVLPFNIPVAHIHGGETTLGAIDNTFRHCLSLMASYHFVSTSEYGEKVKRLTDSQENVWNVGALSLDNIASLDLLTKEAFKDKFSIDLQLPTILCTLHPETKAGDKNKEYVQEFCMALRQIKHYQIVITMPNADPLGNLLREHLQDLIDSHDHIIGVENFGTLGYFSIMKHCHFLLGNTSSGILEAASFNKYVINLGDRQQGRACSDNILSVAIEKEAILDAVHTLSERGEYTGDNIYWQGGASEKILHALKEIKSYA